MSAVHAMSQWSNAGETMLTSREQTAWEPSYLPHSDRAPPLGATAEGAEPATQSSASPVGLFVVLALASAIQAVLYPELLGDIFARF